MGCIHPYRLLMNPPSLPPPLPRQKLPWARVRSQRSFTLVEILVVLAILAIMAAIAAPMITSLLRGNQVDSSIVTLTGVMEQAREAAMSGNTYVWVAFTPTNSIAANGIWVATIQSEDGTESPVNYTITPSWVTTAMPLSIP